MQSATLRQIGAGIFLSTWMFGHVVATAAQQVPIAPEVGVFADTESGLVALKQEIPGVQIAGGPGAGGRALVFPISDVEDLPSAASIIQLLINLPTVGDVTAAGARSRFVVGQREREPDFKLMTVRVGKIRTGYYQVTSPNLTHDWMAGTYAKMTNGGKWKDKHPPAMIGLVLNSTMYPFRLDPSMLAAKR